MMCTPWEWSYGTHWVLFSDRNQRILDARENEPSMLPLRLREGDNNQVLIEGRPEDSRFRVMKLSVNGFNVKTTIRRARAPNDIPFFAIVTQQSATPLPYDVGKDLFEQRNGNWAPRFQKTTRVMGARTFIADEGRLYEQCNRSIHELVWREKDTTREEFEHVTQTSLHWEFKPPFRWHRMLEAVEKTHDPVLTRALDAYSPAFPVQASPHGPLQFPDLLRHIWLTMTDERQKRRLCTAIDKLDSIYNDLCKRDETNSWVPFDPVLNTFIERARTDNNHSITVRVQGDYYTLLFDPGGGASGSNPVLLRPTRYPQLLQSMEDDTVQDLYEKINMLRATHGVSEDTWSYLLDCEEHLHSVVSQHFPSRVVPKVVEYIRSAHQLPERIATRRQSYMPVLLEKYKECEIRQVSSPKPRPITRLDRLVEGTLATGLRVPSEIDTTFRELVTFIDDHRSTKLNLPADSTCSICQQQAPLLGGHCGNATACLACWCTTLVQRDMRCGFCNQLVLEGQLKLCRDTECVERKVVVKKPTQKIQKMNIVNIRQQMHAHLPSFDLNNTHRMEHWYRKLLQCNLISIHQRPKHPQKKKNFKNALKDFRLL